mgnify:CR=1 FL=1
MLKFLAAQNNGSSDWSETAGQHRFTRFANNQKKFTRFKTQVAPQSERPEFVQPPRTPRQGAAPEMNSQNVIAERKRPVTQVHVDERAHLYASTNVPIGILKKALPLRFARLDNEANDIFAC